MNKLIVWSIGIWTVLNVQAAVDVGDKAPEFEAKNQDGARWVLAEHIGAKPIVLYFYPAAMTGGCTRQACAYRDYLKENDALTVVGISADPVENLDAFRQAENLNFTLLSDPDGSIAKAYGVPVHAGQKTIRRTVNDEEVELTREMTAERWTFLIDQAGKVVLVEKKARPVEDLQQVLKLLSTD